MLRSVFWQAGRAALLWILQEVTEVTKGSREFIAEIFGVKAISKLRYLRFLLLKSVFWQAGRAALLWILQKVRKVTKRRD